MNKYPFELPDGSISFILDKSGTLDPQEFIDKYFPGSTLMNQIDEALNPLPSMDHYEAWEDDGSGNIQVNLTLAKDAKKAKITAECNELCKPERDKVIDAQAMSDTTGETDAKAQIAAIIGAAQTAMSSVDSAADLAAVEAVTVAWP